MRVSVVLLMASALTGCGVTLSTYRHAPPGSSGFCAVASCPDTEKPIVMGGKDLGPPTSESLEVWQARGYFVGETLMTVQKKYDAAGYVWSKGPTCACRCFDTKHVALGGKCLDSAHPGSVLHQQIHSGGAK